MLRPARLLPPKRLLTPRFTCQASPTGWGLLPGAPVPTRAGLAPAGLTQLPGRNMQGSLPRGGLEVSRRSPVVASTQRIRSTVVAH
jgi:hypothetical protein